MRHRRDDNFFSADSISAHYERCYCANEHTTPSHGIFFVTPIVSWHGVILF
jgi:hypothetical protein